MKKKRLIIILLIFFLVIVGVSINILNMPEEEFDIEKVLETKEYAYLSDNAKDYIRNYYNETGEVLLTEKNKEEGKGYLNPDYVSYLDGDSTSNTGYVPDPIKDNTKTNLRGTRNVELPSTYDLRDVDGVSYVTPYEKQFGETCWAYAITSAITSALLKNGLEHDAATLDLSERMIDYATTNPSQAIDISINPYFGYDSLSDLNSGGNWKRYSSVLINGIFPIAESDWNYDKEYLGKVKLEDVIDLNKSPYQVNEVINITDNNAELGFDEEFNRFIKQHIMENGAVQVSVGGGVVLSVPASETNPIVDPENSPTHSSLYYRDVNLKTGTDHAVTIIGWNDDFNLNICVDGNGTNSSSYNGTCANGTLKVLNGAWIVKNSSSSDAYDYLAYESVGTEYTLIRDVSLKNWDNSYQSGWIGNVNTEVTFNKGDTKEKLVGVKLLSTTVDDLQNLEVYVDSLDGNSSQLVATFSAEYAGMYTIDIPGDIILSENQFKIKVKGYSGRYSVFTANVDEDIEIMMDDARIENSILYQSLLDNYENLILLKGKSRNLNQNITYIIKNSNNVDVTNKFNISRNYSAGNYIHSLLKFNNDVELGEYTIYTYVDNELYDTSNLTIDYYMEVLEGSGVADDPYLISNPIQLDMIRLDRYAAYKLKNDIDLTYDTQNENGLFYNNGLGWNPITYDDSLSNYGNHKIYYDEGFSGIFDGNNKKITGLYINRPNEDVVGLFRNTRGDYWLKVATIKNLTLENVDITGKNYVGSLVGYAHGIGTVYSTSLVIENISTSGVVKGTNHVGGIIGYYLDGISTSDSPNMLTNNRHRLINLFNSATVEAANYAGGIVGLVGPFHNYTNVTLQVYNWQNIGSVTSEDIAGGLAGQAIARNNNILSINNSINTGKVTGIYTAGIVYSFENEADRNGYSGGSLLLNNVYYVDDTGYDTSNEAITANNVQKYTIVELTDDDIYDSFTNFDTYYNKETINNIPRIPFLKVANPTYTSVADITIDGVASINDYITGSRDMFYVVADTEIATINDSGVITPLSTGSTTIQVTSNYDGYTKAVPLVVSSVQSLNISFDANGGTGSMNNIEFTAGENVIIPDNEFTREGYTFKEWNTSTDGNGTTYNPTDEVVLNANLELYAIWELNNNQNDDLVDASDIAPATYVIGKYMFTRNQNDNYNGVLTTRRIMLASKTISGNTEEAMLIYYKNARGNWVDALTNEPIENVPTSFEIKVTDLDKNLEIAAPILSSEDYLNADIAPATYVIGTHMFTREQNDNYNGVLTTRRIMLASKTISGNTEENMLIYYKNARGNWVDALTNGAVNPEDKFDIAFINLERVQVDEELVSYGDVNEDGVIDGRDAFRLERYLGWTEESDYERPELSAQALRNADANNDGQVNGVDTNLIARFSVGKYPNTLPDYPITDYVLYGDVNENGAVDPIDVTRLLRYVNWTEESDYERPDFSAQALKNADINNDGILNNVDAVLLRAFNTFSLYPNTLPNYPIANYVLYGDVNEDGEVNLQDDILLSNYLNWTEESDYEIVLSVQALKNADINNDGEVNGVDKTLLYDFLADNYPGSLPTSPITVYVILGDVNEDGIIDGRDASRLARYLEWTEESDYERPELSAQALKNADFNEDEEVNNDDVTAIQQYIMSLNYADPTITMSEGPLYVLKGSNEPLVNNASAEVAAGLTMASFVTNYSDASDLEVGQYTLTFTATDSLGHTTSESMVMVVYEPIDCDLDGISEDPTTASRCIYRGSNPNNYVKFNATYSGENNLTVSGGTLYRIIASEVDGTAKIIYNGSLESRAFASTANSSWNSSPLNTYLNNTYYSTFNNIAKNQIKSTQFNSGRMNYCGYANNDECTNTWTNTITDTVNAENSAQATATNVGLPNVYDFLLASTNCSAETTWKTIGTKDANSKYPCDQNNWMAYTNDDSQTWFITPYTSSSTFGRVRAWQAPGAATNNYSIIGANPTISSNVRPVVYLKDSVVIIGGTGTENDPYILGTVE